MAPGTPTLGQQMISPRHSRFSPLCFLPSSSSLLKPSLPRTKPAGMKNSGMEEEAGPSGLGQQQQQQEAGCRVQGFKVLKGQKCLTQAALVRPPREGGPEQCIYHTRKWGDVGASGHGTGVDREGQKQLGAESTASRTSAV